MISVRAILEKDEKENHEKERVKNKDEGEEKHKGIIGRRNNRSVQYAVVWERNKCVH